MNNNFLAIALVMAMAMCAPCATQAKKNGGEPKVVEAVTVKKERNHIRSGNKLYEQKQWAKAEVEYRKALQANPKSVIGQYNLALSLIRQAGNDNKGSNSPAVQAAQLFENVVKATNKNRPLQSRAFYNLGNIAYGSKDYRNAVELYKEALRRNPNDDEVRYNLRMAQLKLKNGDKQNKPNPKPQPKQDKNKQQQQQSKPQPQPQSNMSQQNIDQILKAMQDEERATQQKMNAARERAAQAERMRTSKKW